MSEKIKNFIQKGVGTDFELLDESRTIKFIVSSESVDRDGDIVRQAGMDLSTFQKNPIVLYNHNRNSPIARASDMKIENGNMTMVVCFPEEGVSKLADEVFGLIKAGILNAVSIGFLPKEYGWLEGGDVFEYKEVELLELSVVTIPANPDAVAVERSLKDSVVRPEIETEKFYKLGEHEKRFVDYQGII